MILFGTFHIQLRRQNQWDSGAAGRMLRLTWPHLLDASSHLYKRVCWSVGVSIGPPVGRQVLCVSEWFMEWVEYGDTIILASRPRPRRYHTSLVFSIPIPILPSLDFFRYRYQYLCCFLFQRCPNTSSTCISSFMPIGQGVLELQDEKGGIRHHWWKCMKPTRISEQP